LARLGYSVIGVDNSHVGIGQMNQMAQVQNLNLVGRVTDMYTFEDFGVFDIILLDSMFHFTQKDREKEVGFVQKIVSRIRNGTLLVFCSQDSGHKVQILNNAIDFERPLERLMDKTFKYTFEDKESGHCSVSDYRMIMVKK
ncbi:MAG: class I SAM-dependent methyltransferase, partial [Bacteroidota bacterium]